MFTLYFWDPHVMAGVGTTYGWQFWGTRAISILWTTRDIIAGDHNRWKFWGSHAVSVLGATPFTDVKLMSPPSFTGYLSHVYLWSLSTRTFYVAHFVVRASELLILKTEFLLLCF